MLKEAHIISYNILILDDDQEEIIKLHASLNATLPVKIITFTDSYSAIQTIKQYHKLIAAYIIDIEMKGQQYSGIQVANTIREQPGCSLTPIIFLTSYAHFGRGALQQIHYYDFFTKPCDPQLIIHSLKSALPFAKHRSPLKASSRIVFESNHLLFKFNAEAISSIEIIGRELSVTDLLGHIQTYSVKPSVFMKICRDIQAIPNCPLCRVHRSVIINRNCIKKIEHHKNMATVWLFNLQEWKPVGKTYLHELSIYDR